MFRTKIGMILMLLPLMTGQINAQQVLSLEQCVDSALTNNRKVKQQGLNVSNSAIEYEQARMDLLPNLNAQAGQNFRFGRSLNADNAYESVNSTQSSFGLNSGLMLFDGLRMKYNIEQKKTDMKTTEADLEKLKLDIEVNVTSAYYQVLLYKELLKNAEEQLTLTRQKKDRIKTMIKEGKVAEGEMFELVSMEARDELNQVQAKSNVNLAMLDLAQIIELKDFHRLEVQMPVDFAQSGLQSSEDILSSALKNRPEIQAAELRLESSKRGVDIARSALYPTLSFGASLGTGYYNLQGRLNDTFGKQIQDNLSTNLGFSLNVPLFNRMQTKNRIKSSELAVKNYELALEDTRLLLQKQIEQAYQNALAAQTRWSSATKSETVSREAYKYAELKYENGKSSIYELYQSKNSLSQSVSELAQAKFEFLLRLKILDLMQ